MNTHCSDHESLIFHGQVLGTEDSISVCLEPGLQYAFHYGVPGKPSKISFSINSMKVRGDFDWQRIGDIDWASLTLPFDGMIYTIWVSRPEADDQLPQGQISIAGRGENTTLKLDSGSIISTLPFD